MDSYTDKCPRPIPCGIKKFAYQCENIIIEPSHGNASIRAYIPAETGKEPYPNEEKKEIRHYELKIEKFTQNSISVCFEKVYKTGQKKTYHTTLSFSDLVNIIFENNPANIYNQEPPASTYM